MSSLVYWIKKSGTISIIRPQLHLHIVDFGFIDYTLHWLARFPNMSASALRSPGFLMGLANMFAIGGSTYYLRSHHVYNLEEHEARMDELEGTLRGHIGLIEEALDRLEGKAGEKGKKTYVTFDTAE